MFDVPKGYVLISEEMLQSWGKLEEVREMCQVDITESHSYVEVGTAKCVRGIEDYTVVYFDYASVSHNTKVYILKENYV